MAEEKCWCCESVMMKERIPFTNSIMYWCKVCNPDFDKEAFASEIDWNTIYQ